MFALVRQCQAEVVDRFCKEYLVCFQTNCAVEYLYLEVCSGNFGKNRRWWRKRCLSCINLVTKDGYIRDTSVEGEDARFKNSEILGFCLMGNHFHLLVKMIPVSNILINFLTESNLVQFQYANFGLIFKLKITIISNNSVCYMKCNKRSRIRQTLNLPTWSESSPKHKKSR